MRTDLMDNNLLPLVQPFNAEPWNYTGTEMVLFFPPHTTDWIFIELLDASFNTVFQKAALLRRDGFVMDVDGQEGLSLEGSSLDMDKSYYVIVRQRNHLAIMSNEAIMLSNGIDLSLPANIKDGNNQTVLLANGKAALKAGDFNADGVMTVGDYNRYKNSISLFNQYLAADCNLDGAVSVVDYNYYKPNAGAIGVKEVRY